MGPFYYKPFRFHFHTLSCLYILCILFFSPISLFKNQHLYIARHHQAVCSHPASAGVHHRLINPLALVTKSPKSSYNRNCMISVPNMSIPWHLVSVIFLSAIFLSSSNAQDYEFSPTGGKGGDDGGAVGAPPPGQDECNGIFVTYTFTSREKEYPLVKNATAQSWAFKSQLYLLNSGVDELKAWQVFIGFQHDEILVSAEGAMVADDLPAKVGNNGTILMGYPKSDLKTAIDTAADFTQMATTVQLTGTQFGMKKGTPMPKTIKLKNDGYKCPAPKRQSNQLTMCCKKDPKFKSKDKNKFMPRQNGDLSLSYDVLQAFEGNYLAQVTIDNNHPLGRLDHWNLTWEWMRGEFINTMRGAYTHKKDSSECIYGPQGLYYSTMDFSPVMNCQRKPVISDLPKERANDEKVGKLPYCCRNGTLLPVTMNETESRAIFQLQVYKMPPDLKRTVLNPPHKWKINGVVNPDYKCGAPIRVDPTEFPDPSGLAATTTAIATWQVTCNITKPKPKANKCCVSFSAYYAESAIPCNTCACGCDEGAICDKNAPPMLIPPQTLLVPFVNRTAQAKAWASLKHLPNPVKLPCADNCGVSINWHVDTDYTTGWTARMTLFNWDEQPFEDWFTAIQMKKAFDGYENVYSFNGTKLPKVNNTIFFQGKEGLNFLMGEVNGTKPSKPRVPGKQQSVISFLKKNTPGINVAGGDGFPDKVYFNGEECALPPQFPKRSGAYKSSVSGLPTIIFGIVTFVLLTDRFH